MGARIDRGLRRGLLVGLMAAVVAWGCGAGRHHRKGIGEGADAEPDPQETVAASVADLAPYLNKVDGRCDTDGTSSRFVAYFEGGEVRYIIEQTDPGDYGTTVAVNEYYFDDGRLFHYHENRRSVVFDSGTSSTTATVVRLSFDSSGDLSRAVKTIDGGEATVTDDEVLAVRRHVEHLRLAAREAYLRGRRTARS